tara:strand:+ start:16869 stop:17372 length:504 start_codon:yes stop_codon:yes gene_type:complete
MKTVIRKNKKIALVLVALLVFASCDSNRVFDQYYAVDNTVWNKDNPINFEFQVTDTISKNDLYIQIRNNNEYAFSNLFLITHLDFPDGKKIVDTLQYAMTDKNGRFLGSGLSEIKESKLYYKESRVFPMSGKYKVSIKQAMRKNGTVEGVKELEGVTDVGLRIEKVE